MDNAVIMGKNSATGSFQLFIGKIASTIFLAIGSIIVGIFIDVGEYGLYAIAIVPAATFILFQDWGVNSALTKYCANYRAAKKEGDLRGIIIDGLTFDVITGLFLTLLSVLMANFVASVIYRTPESAFLVTIASITIFFGALNGCSMAIFVGFERMKLSAITLIISATLQGFLSPLLVYLGFGAVGVVIGYSAGIVAAGITGTLLLYFAIFRKLPQESTNKTKIFKTLKPLLRYGIPLSIAVIIGGISTYINQFVMASFTDVTLIGNFKIATNFAVFLTFFTYPITTVLFPAFSKLDPSKDKQLLEKVFSSSVKYSSLFLVPATMALMILSASMISTIYADKWFFAPFFLTMGIISNFFVLLGNISYGRLLYATGETKFLMKMNLLSLFIDVPLAFLLIPRFGILGLIILQIVAGLPSMIIGLSWTWKRYGTKADFRNSAKILLASTIAGLTSYLFQTGFVASAWIKLVLGAILFLVTYLVSVSLVGAVNQADINNLRFMFSGLGPLSKLLKSLLTLVEKPIRIKEKLLERLNRSN